MDLQTLLIISQITFFLIASLFLLAICIFTFALTVIIMRLAKFIKNLPAEIISKAREYRQNLKEKFVFYDFFHWLLMRRK